MERPLRDDGEMERVLEKKAELIGQYEDEKKAQVDWERQFNGNQSLTNQGCLSMTGVHHMHLKMQCRYHMNFHPQHVEVDSRSWHMFA